MQIIKAFFMSLGIYTRFPVKFKSTQAISPQQMLLSLVAVGALIGGLWGGLYKLTEVLKLPAIAAAALLTVFPHWISGYLHLDAYTETTTAILSQKSGYAKEERRGLLGMIALVILFVFGFAGAFHFVDMKYTFKLLIFIPLFSRELAVLMIFLLPALSGGEYTAQKQPKKAENTLILLVIFIASVVLCITLTGIQGSVLLSGMLCAFLASAVSAKARVGISGETAGYSLTIAETAGLFMLAIFQF